jgi:transposase-like protein
MAPSHLFWWRKLAREGRLRADDEAVGFAEAVVGCEAINLAQRGAETYALLTAKTESESPVS